jgi:hypothetical protein
VAFSTTRAKGVAFAREKRAGLRLGLSRWLKVACGAFSERVQWLFQPRGQKAWLLPAKSGPVCGQGFLVG